MTLNNYTADQIKSLDWREHIRLRPGMYIGKLGDGSAADDGLYVLFKEIMDNSIDEYMMGFGKQIEIQIDDKKVNIRDYGRGIPLTKLIDCVSKINTGGKYDNQAFQKSVGLNGVGMKAVNALSDYFEVNSFRAGQQKQVIFEKGLLKNNPPISKTTEKNGTYTQFIPDASLFKNYKYNLDYIHEQITIYTFLNTGLQIKVNGKNFKSKQGLLDLLTLKGRNNIFKYPIIHFKGHDIEFAFTHINSYQEQNYAFVNGQYTSQGGTHLNAFKESLLKVMRNFYNKNFEGADLRTGILSAIAIRVQDPVFESQTKTKLGSNHIAPKGSTIRTFINDFIKTQLDDFLHKDNSTAQALLKHILEAEKERKEIAGIKKIAHERAKKANIYNKKLRDCKLHWKVGRKHPDQDKTTIFITEGDSASGSITKSRDIYTQAVFSLRGKPLNCFGLSKKIVYHNEEFNLLQHALNIENSLENLRYKKIVIATDADVDGMHIRLLLLTFFLQFFPALIQRNHVFILETPLFRVRNQKETHYCYSEAEKQTALTTLTGKIETTRFKGLGEISPSEFKGFIGPAARLQPVHLSAKSNILDLLTYYMGKNTPQRQTFIIDNLHTERDEI